MGREKISWEGGSKKRGINESLDTWVMCHKKRGTNEAGGSGKRLTKRRKLKPFFGGLKEGRTLGERTIRSDIF